MQLEWDEAKNEINIRKHGIDFADVHAMFDAPMLVDLDERAEYGEERWIGIGPFSMIVAVVVFTERGNDTIRIISARKRRQNMSDNATNKPIRTDWERLIQQQDEDIDTSDIPLLTDAFFARAKLLLPRDIADRTIQVDADILQWFKRQAPDYQQSINHVLRSYIESHTS